MRVIDIPHRTLNGIANAPDVLVMIDPDVLHIDLSWIYDVPGAFVKGCDGVAGAVAFLPHPGERYEVHYFMPGNAGLPAIRAVIDWLFTRTNVQAIFGFTPRSNLAARSVNRWLGGSPVSERIDGAGRPCVVYELTRDKWASTFPAENPAARTKPTTI